MSFAKPNVPKENTFDDVQRLMCSVQGCQRRWSVHMEGMRPMCSEHQWSGSKPAIKEIAALLSNSKPVKHWQDDEAF